MSSKPQVSTNPPDLDIKSYRLISKIGEGNFSKVYRIKEVRSGEYYAAKVAKLMIDEDTIDTEQANLLFREVNLMSSFNHPSILKFVGYYPTNFENDPVPTLITEMASNGSLRYLIECENSGLSPEGWTPTKKLIIIYGIASGMSYLHKNKVLHRDLKPENILIDDYLHPKIADFGLSKLTDFLSVSMNYQSQKGMKGTPIYMSPEILRNEEYSKAGDVYAFGFIVFEIITGEQPYKNINMLQLMKKVSEGARPTIGDDVPDSYRELIESCWSQEANQRPSFDEIVSNLKNDERFITELIDGSEFYDYVDFIDSYQSTFDVSKRVIHFSEFIENQGRNKSIQKVAINKIEESSSNDEKDTTSKEEPNPTHQQNPLTKKEKVVTREEKSTVNINKQKVLENETSQKIDEKESDSGKIKEIETTTKSTNINYPLSEFSKLPKRCQNLVEESATDSSKLFIVGKSLIEGTNEFPKDIKLGLQYINESINHKSIESIIYYCKMLMKGDVIGRDLEKANECISSINTTQDARVFVMKGKINYKLNNFKESVKYYEEGVKLGDKESMYQYGKMLFIGEGIKKNEKRSIEFISKSKDLGYKKGECFLKSYDTFKHIKEFNSLPSETQIIFITNNVKNILKRNEIEFGQIYFEPSKTEKLYFNKSLASSNFLKCLEKYKNISIEIEYPSKYSEKIIDLVVKIKDRKINNIKIGIVFTSFPRKISKTCFSQSISYQKISNSVRSIKIDSFKDCKSLTQIIIPSSVTSIGNSAFEECSSLTQITIPSSVTSIGNSAFSYCSSLTQITIPSSVTSIGNYAFSGCFSLTQITIPSSVTSIGKYAFSGCLSLTQITIPSSVTSFGNNIFNGIKELKILGNIKHIPNKLFSGCSSLTQITIPSSVTSIGFFAFSGCLSLTEITIPSSVTSIGESVFDGCSSLTQITFSITFSITSIGKSAFSYCSSLTQITIPSSVTSIGNYAFSGCSSLTQITIPSSVTSIGNSAFSGCSSLAQIAFSTPSFITSIGYSAFFGCSSLTQITIPSSMTSIGDYTFEGFSSLTQITIPSSVTSIGNYAFDGCSSLTQITIPSSVTSIGDSAFSGCSSLAQITIPSFLKKEIGVIASKTKIITI